MQHFWQNIEALGKTISEWDESLGVGPQLSGVCDGFCSALRHTDASLAIADPRNMSRVRSIRACCADRWSAINSQMEYQVAEELKEQCQTYQEFCEKTQSHWLLRESPDLIAAEQTLLVQQNLNLKEMKVAMVGPGAIPYTGLAMAAAGAHVTLIDLYGPACQWSNTWMQRFFPNQPWQVMEAPGQNVDYTGYDLVIVASMLFGRGDVLTAINRSRPSNVLVRTTSGRRPMSLLLPQVPEDELSLLSDAQFVAESNPPMHVGNIGLLYRYPQA